MSLIAAAHDDYDGSGRRLSTQSMPGTLDRRYCRDQRAPFDGTLLAKAADDLSRSLQEGQTTGVDHPRTCSSSMLRSSDVVDSGVDSVDNLSLNTSNLAGSEVDVTPRKSADISATGSTDVQNGDVVESSSVSSADADRKASRSRAVAYRQWRSRSDETKVSGRRRKEDVGLRRRLCRSLERRQSSSDVKHVRSDVMTSPGGRDKSGGDLSCGGTVKKSDSFDSGIDTKSESTSPRTGGTDDLVDSGVNSRPDAVSPPSSTFHDVTPEVLPLTAAEVEYDRRAARLVRCLDDDDEAELREVLTSSASYRVPTCYLRGVFDNVVRPLSSNLAEVDHQYCELSVTDDSSAAADELKVNLYFQY